MLFLYRADLGIQIIICTLIATLRVQKVHTYSDVEIRPLVISEDYLHHLTSNTPLRCQS